MSPSASISFARLRPGSLFFFLASFPASAPTAADAEAAAARFEEEEKEAAAAAAAAESPASPSPPLSPLLSTTVRSDARTMPTAALLCPPSVPLGRPSSLT
jgi:hypothetical protein